MGRVRTVNLNLPRGMRARHRKSGTYYYLDTGDKEIPLGAELLIAMQKWRELVGSEDEPECDSCAELPSRYATFRRVAECYLRAPVFKAKAPRTQKDNMGELGFLFQFFDAPPAPLDAIQPHHVAKYRDWRQSTHSTQELALLSAIWNWAREQGITALANPTTGIRRNKGKGRDVYVDDALYARVYAHADQATRDAMDLAHLAAQRPGDNLKMREEDIQRERPGPDDPPGWDGRALYVQQGKTGAKLRVRIIGRLAQVVDRILTRKAATGSLCSALVVNEKGQPLAAAALDGRFGKAREAAGVKPQEFQMRDLRAKAGTETDWAAGRTAAQDLLGHTTPAMTNRYVRHRQGKLVEPVQPRGAGAPSAQ